MSIVISPDATVADCIDNAVALSGYQAVIALAVDISLSDIRSVPSHRCRTCVRVCKAFWCMTRL